MDGKVEFDLLFSLTSRPSDVLSAFLSTHFGYDCVLDILIQGLSEVERLYGRPELGRDLKRNALLDRVVRSTQFINQELLLDCEHQNQMAIG